MANTRSFGILIVDDLVTVRIALKEMLARDGVTLVEAGGAEAAVKAAKARKFDLICLDLKLDDHGDGDGYTTTAALRALQPKTPIFIISNRDRGLDRMETARQGASAYIPKGELFREDQAGPNPLYVAIQAHSPSLAPLYL